MLCKVPVCVLNLSGSPCSSIQASWHSFLISFLLGCVNLEPWGNNPWMSSSPLRSGLFPMVFYKGDPPRGWIQLKSSVVSCFSVSSFSSSTVSWSLQRSLPWGFTFPTSSLLLENKTQPSISPLCLIYKLERVIVISEPSGIHVLCPESPMGCHYPGGYVMFLVNSHLSQQGRHNYTVALAPAI